MTDSDIIRTLCSGKYDEITVKEFREMFVDERDKRHKYEPDPEYPWFCKRCGYAEHEKLMHY